MEESVNVIPYTDSYDINFMLSLEKHARCSKSDPVLMEKLTALSIQRQSRPSIKNGGSIQKNDKLGIRRLPQRNATRGFMPSVIHEENKADDEEEIEWDQDDLDDDDDFFQMSSQDVLHKKSPQPQKGLSDADMSIPSPSELDEPPSLLDDPAIIETNDCVSTEAQKSLGFLSSLLQVKPVKSTLPFVPTSVLLTMSDQHRKQILESSVFPKHDTIYEYCSSIETPTLHAFSHVTNNEDNQGDFLNVTFLHDLSKVKRAPPPLVSIQSANIQHQHQQQQQSPTTSTYLYKSISSALPHRFGALSPNRLPFTWCAT
eukprot:gene2069-5128_t